MKILKKIWNLEKSIKFKNIKYSIKVLPVLLVWTTTAILATLFTKYIALLILGLYFSIFIHEVGHAVVYHKLGFTIQEIRLDYITARVLIDFESKEPTDSDIFKGLLAGPSTNLVLAILALFLPLPFNFMLFWPNAVLGMSNFIPLYILDGHGILLSLGIELVFWKRIIVSYVLALISILCPLGAFILMFNISAYIIPTSLILMILGMAAFVVAHLIILEYRSNKAVSA